MKNCIQVSLKLIRTSIRKCPPTICNQSIFSRTSFSVWNQKICLSVFTGCHGLAGRKFFQPILKRKRITKGNHKTNASGMKIRTFLIWEVDHQNDTASRAAPRPAQRQVAGKPPKTTFRFLKVSEKKSWQTRLYQNVYTPYQRFYKKFSTKNMPKTFKIEKNTIFDLESKFSP